MKNYYDNAVNARHREEKKGFKIHRTVYICVIGLLVLVNKQCTPEINWFIYPMLAWGIGLMVHYLNIREYLHKTRE